MDCERTTKNIATQKVRLDLSSWSVISNLFNAYLNEHPILLLDTN
jgi:hypothetical protein